MAIIFPLVFIFFYKIQFAVSDIPGFDGYYHIKIASLIRDQGLIKDFPWLEFPFGQNPFVDHHLLFHFLLIPFTFLRDLTVSAKMAAVTFATLMVTMFGLCLYRSSIKGSFIWVALLLASSTPFLYRMSLPRAGSLSLSFLFLSFLLLKARRYYALGVTAFFFVWLYGGFSLLLVLGITYFASEVSLAGRLSLKGMLSILVGVVAGVIINPYFPQNISFLYLQTVSAGLAHNVPGGTEWNPYDTWFFVKSSAPVLIIFAWSICTLAISGNKLRQDSLTLLLMSLIFLGLYFKSRRFVEYWVPFTLMASAFILRDTWQNTRFYKIWNNKALKILILILLLSAIFPLLAHRYSLAKDSVGGDGRGPARYREAGQWLAQNTPGSLVYTSDWDDFPELFFYNSRNKYLIGLDPAFMYKKNKALFEKWVSLNQGKATGDVYDLFLKTFKTVYLFTDYNHPEFISMVERTEGIELAYGDRYARIYRLLPRK